MRSILWLFFIGSFANANAVTIDFEDLPIIPASFYIPSYSTDGFILANSQNGPISPLMYVFNETGNALAAAPDVESGSVVTLSRTKYTSTDNGLFDLCSISLNAGIAGRTELDVSFSGYRSNQEVVRQKVTIKALASLTAPSSPNLQKKYFSDFINLDKVIWSTGLSQTGLVFDDITVIPRNGKHQCPKIPVCDLKPIDMSRVYAELGYASIIYATFGTPADISLTENRSTLRLFENGIELFPAHTPHAAIRTDGKGRFSHWSLPNGSSEALRFSASDNSNPKTNGRQYNWCVSQ